MKSWTLIALFLVLVSCDSTAQQSKKKSFNVTKTEAEWKAQLTPLQYHVLREEGTERAFTGKYDKFYKKGTYICAACKHPLYESKHKYNSGSGWPAFDRALKNGINYDVDYKIGYKRVELECNNCGGHLGHMFEDGPKETTGKRHCINSASLQFIPKSN